MTTEEQESVGEPNYACLLSLDAGMCKTYQVGVIYIIYINQRSGHVYNVSRTNQVIADVMIYCIAPTADINPCL